MKINFRKILIFNILCLSLLSATAQTAADKILGTYYVKDDVSGDEAKIKIYKNKSGTYDGRIVWLKNPNFKNGQPKRDLLNPDPAKRNTLGTEIQIVFHFKYDSDDKQWINGEIYDPWHGKTYKCKAWFEGKNALRVRGFVGVPAFGRTMVWKKLQ